MESHSYPNYYEVLSAWIVPITVVGFIIENKIKFALIGILNVVWCISSYAIIGYGMVQQFVLGIR